MYRVEDEIIEINDNLLISKEQEGMVLYFGVFQIIDEKIVDYKIIEEENITLLAIKPYEGILTKNNCDYIIDNKTSKVFKIYE